MNYIDSEAGWWRKKARIKGSVKISCFPPCQFLNHKKSNPFKAYLLLEYLGKFSKAELVLAEDTISGRRAKVHDRKAKS